MPRVSHEESVKRFELAHQLADSEIISNRKIAEILGVTALSVGRWLKYDTYEAYSEAMKKYAEANEVKESTAGQDTLTEIEELLASAYELVQKYRRAE